MPEIPAKLIDTFEGRPCVTGLTVMQHFGPELRKWVEENCTPAVNANVYFLPCGQDRDNA